MRPCASKHRSGASSRNGSSETGTIATGSDQPVDRYTGRFAPSPTGPLHFGSLLAAVASYLEARRHAGQWLLRVEDIDPPREQPGATDQIIASLEQHGFEWDGPVGYQSHSREAHEAAIEMLRQAGQAYPCDCSRRDLADAPRSSLGIIYPGTCRAGCDAAEFALRVRTTAEPVAYDDRLQGHQAQALESESGDFIILRRDGLIAYQLAVVVDDYLQGITDVVRGIDLMDSTPRQLWLQTLLGYPAPSYCHIPVLVNERGQKLSKSHGAKGISNERPVANLVTSLRLLGQRPPDGLAEASLDDVWDWAGANWDITTLAGRTQISGNFQAVATD